MWYKIKITEDSSCYFSPFGVFFFFLLHETPTFYSGSTQFIADNWKCRRLYVSEKRLREEILPQLFLVNLNVEIKNMQFILLTAIECVEELKGDRDVRMTTMIFSVSEMSVRICGDFII